MASTAYMNLNLPVPTVTLGPIWATQLNTALTTIDCHDHTDSKGKKVPSSGLNINANLDLGGYSFYNSLSVKFTSQPAPLTGATNVSSIYVSGGNLFFTNGSGGAVQITSGGSILSAPGTTISLAPTQLSGDLSIAAGDSFVMINVNTSAARAISLPSISAVAAGRFYLVKDGSGSARANNITITPDGSDTIDGAASAVLNSDRGALMIISDGVSNWHLV